MTDRVSQRWVLAVAEVVAVAAVYILISTSAVGAIDASLLFPNAWSPAERATGGGFFVGAVIQVLLVLIGAYLLGLRDLREAVSATWRPSTRQAWIIASIATVIHIGTAMLLFLPQPGRIFELSSLNLILTVVPTADGWSQEVLFRGYVLFRLARADVPVIAAILLSGFLFAAIHLGYAGDSGWSIAAPLVGTFMLGCFYAWAVHRGGRSLKPVVVCHVLIIAVLQPWLALAR